MNIVIQRVFSASLKADGVPFSSIEKGLLVFVGVYADDSVESVAKAAEKIAHLRIFPDERGKMFYSVKDIGGSVMVVSNFTLCADLRSRRPDFTKAAKADKANEYYELLKSKLSELVKTESGVFGADMEISTVNDGPVTVTFNI